jgi:hypothetical protein
MAHGGSYKNAVTLISWAPLSTNISSISCHCWSRNWSWIWSGLSGSATLSEKYLTAFLTPTKKDAPDRLVILMSVDVRGRPVQQKFGRTGSIRGGTHQRCQSQRMVLGIWIGTFFQEELNKVEIGDVARRACIVQRCSTVWDRYSLDIRTAFNKLFCQDRLVCMGQIVARICHIGQVVERSSPHLPFLQRCVVVSKQHVRIDKLKQHEKWTVWPRKLLRVGVNKNE